MQIRAFELTRGWYDFIEDMDHRGLGTVDLMWIFDMRMLDFWGIWGWLQLPDISVSDIKSAEIDEREGDMVISMTLDGRNRRLREFHVRGLDTSDHIRHYTLHDIHIAIVTDSDGVPKAMNFETLVSRRGTEFQRIAATITFNAFGHEVEIVLPESDAGAVLLSASLPASNFVWLT